METVLAMSSNINYADKTIYPNLERFKNLPFKVDIYISGHDKYSLLNSYNNINIYSSSLRTYFPCVSH